MLVSEVLSVPAKGRRVRRLPAVVGGCRRYSLRVAQKSEKSADSLAFWRPQAVKVRRVSRFGAFHKIGELKSKDSIAFPLAFAVWKLSKMQQSRVPACFFGLEVLKNATVSRSRLFFLSIGVKKCNSLVFPLVFAVSTCQKIQQSRVPARFCCQELFLCSRTFLLSGSACIGNGFWQNSRKGSQKCWSRRS